MNEEERLRDVLSRIISVVERYVAQLEDLDPASREGARVADAITKLLGRVKDFEDRLTAEEEDLVVKLSKARKTAIKHADNVRAAAEYMRLALMEMGEAV